jgi:hypothetical protein
VRKFLDVSSRLWSLVFFVIEALQFFCNSSYLNTSSCQHLGVVGQYKCIQSETAPIHILGATYLNLEIAISKLRRLISFLRPELMLVSSLYF